MIVIKHRYIAGRRGGGGLKSVGVGKALAHVKYIQHRPGPDRERGGREFFNEREDRLDVRDMREAIKELGGSRVVVHKVTLAPEINPQDKKAFTREVMERLGRDMGKDLSWFAVEHDNTDHHHIHVVVLGEDRNGSEVRITLAEIDKAKEHGDRYLERWHRHELERSRREREERERERRAERTREREAARQERIREGRELPWLHQKIVREQLEPYSQWKEKEEQRERETDDRRREEKERPYHQDTIEAAGKEWSKGNNLKELRDLNEYLWDNYEERLPKDEYRKLTSWIKDKERLGEEADESRQPVAERRRDEFEFGAEKYSKGDSYEKLSGLAERLRDSEERLPFENYQKLRGWIENRDRERWSGALEKQIELTHKRFERSKTAYDLKSQEGGRVIDPLQEQMMRNPIVGLFMTEAAIASEIVRWIELDDRNRDYLKENRDELERGKRDIEEKERERGEERIKMPWEFDKSAEARENIEKGIEKNKEAKERERQREQEQRLEQERKQRDRDNFERGGWY